MLMLIGTVESQFTYVSILSVGIFHQILVNRKLGMDKLLLSNEILPFLLPLSVEPGLNPQQVGQILMNYS